MTKSLAEDRYVVREKLPHATVEKDDNPYCPTCGWRTYPMWGPHSCKVKGTPITEEYLKRVRHVAGDLLSNLHFFRHQPEEQVASLVLALAYALGRNREPRRALKTWRGIQPKIEKLIRREGGKPAGDSIVAAVNFPLRIRRRQR